MRTDLVAGELTLLQSGAYDEHWRLKVANGSGTLIDISDRLKDGSVRLPDPDSPIGTAEVTLWREINDTASDSLSPLVASSYNVLDDGVTASPLIHIGRSATLELAVTARGGARPADGSASWHEILGGFVKQPYWPKRYGDIRIELHDRAYKLKRTFIEAPNTYAVATTIEATIQAVLDDVMGSGVYPVTVDDVAAGGTTGSALSVNYLPDIVPVWDAIQALAMSIGWVLWYRYNSSGVAVLTLTEPRRAKTVADYTFTLAQIADIEELTIIEEDIRNVVVVAYVDGSDADQSVTAEDATSISTYGGIRRYMKISEGTDSPIRSSAAATTLINAALTDTKDPDADQSIRTIGAWWPGEPSVDLNSFTGNEFVYDSAQGLAPYAISLQFAQGALSSATIRARGKPSAGSGTWRVRAGKETNDVDAAARLNLQDFREISRTATTIKYGWTIGPNLAMSFIHDFQEQQPYTEDKWPVDTRVPDTIDRNTSVEYAVAIPEAGFIRYFQVEGRKTDGTFGDMERVLIFPTSTEADFVAFLEATVNQTDGSVVIDGWTTDRAKSVAYAYNVGTDPTAPTIAMAEAQGTGATGGGLATGFSSDFAISLAASTLAYGEKIKVLVVAYLNADGTGADTTATDHGLPAGAQAERFKITASGQLADGIVVAGKLTEDSQSFVTDIVFSSADWDTAAWTSGTVTMADGTAYSINSGNTGDLSTNALRYIYFDAAVSTTVLQVTTTAATSTGDGVVLMAVAKRAAAGASSGQRCFYVPAVGVLGLNGDNIGVNSITAASITAGTITAAEITGATLSAIYADMGTLTAGEIAVGSISISAATERIMMGAATAPLTGVGVFMGKDGTDYELRVGDPAGDYIHWDGSTWHYPGAITNVGADHGALAGLADDDHANYVHISTARTISALHTFSNASGLKTNNIVERTAAAGVTIDGLVIKDTAVITGSWTATKVAANYGGTGLNSSQMAAGDIMTTVDGSAWTPLVTSTAGKVLTVGTGGIPEWATASGTVSAVTVGTGLDVATGTTTPVITLSLDELPEHTGTLTATDRLVLVDAVAGAQYAETISLIPLTIFNNDAGWSTGTVTSVTLGEGVGIDLTGTNPITTSGTVTITLDLSEVPDNTAAVTSADEMVLLDGGVQGRKAFAEIGLGVFDNTTTGFTNSAGTVTSLSVGTGLDVATATTTPAITLSLDELPEHTGALTATDRLVCVDATAGAQYAETISLIPLSIFSNDAGWTANTGDITGVTAGTNLNGGGASGSVTLNLDATITLTDVVVTSDIRLKTVLDSVTPASALAVVSGLDVFRYTIDADERVRVGVSAQQVQAVAPELVFADDSGMLGVDYARGGVSYCVRAIQGLLARIEELER